VPALASLALAALAGLAGCGESVGPIAGPAPYGNRAPNVDAPLGVVAQVGDTLLIPIVATDPDSDEVTVEVRVVLTAEEVASGYFPAVRLDEPSQSLWFHVQAEDIPVREFIVIGFDRGGLADTARINVVVNP
jgi:hypothetical protein